MSPPLAHPSTLHATSAARGSTIRNTAFNNDYKKTVSEMMLFLLRNAPTRRSFFLAYFGGTFGLLSPAVVAGSVKGRRFPDTAPCC
jgi:hypothetical protein